MNPGWSARTQIQVRLKSVSYGESRNRQVVPGAKGPGDVGLENRRVALVIDHAAIVTDQLATVR